MSDTMPRSQPPEFVSGDPKLTKVWESGELKRTSDLLPVPGGDQVQSDAEKPEEETVEEKFYDEDGKEIDPATLSELQKRAFRMANKAREQRLAKEATGAAVARPKPPELSIADQLRQEREADRAGTYPGTSPEVTRDRSAGNESSNKFNRAVRIVTTADPNSRDPAVIQELREAREFLESIDKDPDSYIPDYRR